MCQTKNVIWSSVNASYVDWIAGPVLQVLTLCYARRGKDTINRKIQASWNNCFNAVFPARPWFLSGNQN